MTWLVVSCWLVGFTSCSRLVLFELVCYLVGLAAKIIETPNNTFARLNTLTIRLEGPMWNLRLVDWIFGLFYGYGVEIIIPDVKKLWHRSRDIARSENDVYFSQLQDYYSILQPKCILASGFALLSKLAVYFEVILYRFTFIW